MPTILKTKNSVTTTVAPTTLQQGELAVNITDKKMWVGNAATTPVLLVNGGSDGVFTSITDSGNLTFTGTGNRILGDFSNATVANRVAFQTSTTNGQTRLTVFPNGTEPGSAIDLFNSATDPANSGLFSMRTGSTEMAIVSNRTGTGTYLPLTMLTGGSERLRIDTSGNVGIGTGAITQLFANYPQLGIKGGTTVAGGTIQFTSSNGTIATNIVCDTNATYFAAVGGAAMAFAVGGSGTGTERMRITDIGNVGIGSTGKTGTRLNVVSASASVSAGDFYVNAASSTAIPALTLSKYDNNSTTSQVFLQFAINQYAAGSGQINANGANAAAFGSFSDVRLKENIKDLPPQLGNITALRPVEFDYKAGGHQIGFIAQEMQEVYSDVVGEGADGMLMITGWSKTEARLVKAIQEQQTLIENLTTRLNALEGK